MPDQTSRPAKLTLRTPSDLHAAVPVILGFHPTDSLVLMTFGPNPFHARIDFDRDADAEHMALMARTLLEPTMRSRADAVLVAVYSAGETWPSQLDGVAYAFANEGIEVKDVVHFDTDAATYATWASPSTREPIDPASVVACETILTEVRRSAVLESREALEQAVEPDPHRVLADSWVAPGMFDDALLHGELAIRWCASHAGPALLSDEDLALLLAMIRADLLNRDAAWAQITRETAEDFREFWLDVVQRTPDCPALVPAAAVLGFACWMSGDGAGAWVALDRAARVDPEHDYSMCALLAGLLEKAVPPSEYVVAKDQVEQLVAQVRERV